MKMGISAAISNSICCRYLVRDLDSKGGLRNFVSFEGICSANLTKAYVSMRAQLPRKSLLCNLQTIDFEERTSPAEVKKEIEQCYKLIQKHGRGVVYLGSSRLGPDHPFYSQSFELGKEIATLLDCTSWSGAGPGLMDAITNGALQAGKPVGGFKIGKESGEWTATNFHPYLPLESYITCRFFSARKHGLVDAAIRANYSDRTAVVALPGGIGTLDEIFEILALAQLKRVGSVNPIPFLLMNYDSFYSKLLDFLSDCEDWGIVSKGEVESLCKVCDNNTEAVAYLTDFYGLSCTDETRTASSLSINQCKTLSP